MHARSLGADRQVAIEADSHADVSRIDVVAPVDLLRDLVRGAERRCDLRVDALVVDRIRGRRRITRLVEHAREQPVHLGEGFQRRVDDERLELGPRRLPLVAVEARLLHGHRASLPRLRIPSNHPLRLLDSHP